MAGYSGTPLAKKLGIWEACEVYPVGAPANYRKLLAPLPKNVRFSRRLTTSTDIVHLFTRRRADVESYLREWYGRLKSDGCVWVSWPKKSAGIRTDVTENVIREVALPIGLVDVKVCAVDETWSGLKLVIRRENRSKRS